MTKRKTSNIEGKEIFTIQESTSPFETMGQIINELRDEIIHGLASDEIISFLTKNDILITKLEILNFTIIANMLGFNNIQMNPYYNEFDIFSEKSTFKGEKNV